ncbi:hypothetical protein PPTG_10343 [Phytophthora nicotianae INRA-310]|uniref:Uncharacterized protein n=1 Tax=Phytophthora nicotianae (strain INRA-310) TaxID=761204 RepID=W2QE74_PHYN3|nr:hypothetical protein PPTG_10343 [Phytophthora nicotianae INRA-310]ETN11467.1 hypothetical protein PPTG_10343 [Phytophthora nicotianae INRA-310]
MATTDSTEATEQLQDIKELMGSIKKEKTRRDAKLASSGTDFSNVPHGRLVEKFGKLERSGEEVVALQEKLESRLRCLDTEDTDRDEEFQELLEVSYTMEAALSARSLLERQWQDFCVKVLQMDAGIRDLTTILLNDEEILATMTK